MKPHISNSQLGMYERCGEAYRRRYIEGERIPPAVALLCGTGVHEGARINFIQKIETRKDLPKKDIVESAVTAYEERLETDGCADDKAEQGKGKDDVVTLTGLYAQSVAPEYQPVIVEQRQRIALPGEYDLMAVMDLADDKGVVVDIKTAGRKKRQADADNSEQLSFYALVYKAATGKMPKFVRLECLVNTKTPNRQQLESTRKTADLESLVARVNTMIRGIEAGVYMPCNRDSWMCSEKWCGYYKTCKYVNGGK